jgi:hypothetical protein
MSIERPLPKIRQRRAIFVTLGFAALTVSSLFLPIPLWLIGVGLIAVLIVFYYQRCCPICGHRMVFRAEPFLYKRSRVLFDCKHCDVVWNSGEIQGDEGNLGGY